MERPGIVTYLSPIQIDIRYKVYCEHLNSIIRKMIREKGKSIHNPKSVGKGRYYRDYIFDFTQVIYRDGTDEYFISIKSELIELPDGINPYLVYENGWIDVYHFRDGRYKEVLLLNVPGNWE